MATIEGRVVIVVEDDDSLRQALGRLLEIAGFRAVSFGSAEALLSTGGVEGAVCVVSDFKLPAMSGLELTTELAARGGWPSVILMTAHDSPEVRDEAKRRGASGYLVKPFHGSVLLAAIARVAGPTHPP
ncbi:response regulator [Variovorax sp. J31P207]|uniref:response regulator transcription factor n=1 Tax=Variovorax sp. J31P207 TaxID=3053510 RepID=UPI00257613A4|nr:response regulator [Variovorax sp. J31P207]MDM0072145.1 response regulator [Variovorax sp. J31P207]